MVLLSNYPAEQNRTFIDWLVRGGLRGDLSSISGEPSALTDPTDYGRGGRSFRISGRIHAAAVLGRSTSPARRSGPAPT